MQPDPPTARIIAPPLRGFRQKAEEWYRVAGMFLWGIALACLSGEDLMRRHWPHSRWRGVCAIIIFILATIDLARPNRKQAAIDAVLWIGLLILLVPLYLLRSHIWVAPAIGVVFSGFLWASGESRRSPIPIAVSGSVLGGVATLLAPWPNPERALLASVYAGAAVALQGVWNIIGHMSGLHPVTATASTQSRRSPVPLLLTFGKIETQQISYPGLEHQLRMRHESRIRELESLGFRYFCCYTESFAAGRLMLLFPALVVLRMHRGRDMVRLRGGRIHTHFMLLASRDNTTFAHAFGLGVKFHTGFSDGTFLVTMNANAAIPDIDQPPMLKRYRQGSIADAWADHQNAIQSLEAAGKRAVRQLNFQPFAEMSHRETQLQSQS